MSPEQDPPRPLMDHLNELLQRGRRSVLWIFLGAVAGYIAAPYVLGLLSSIIESSSGAVAPKLIYTQPFEKFWVYLRISMIAGIFFVFPLLAYEIAAFVGPGLKKTERRSFLSLGISSWVAMNLGCLVGYFYVLPAVVNAILRFGSTPELPLWTISSYVNTSLGILLICAVFFELPVIMVHLTHWGWVDPSVWAKGRRLAIVANALLSAVLSPPDPISMIAMMIPVQILYESGIVLSRVARWLQNESKKQVD
jgi:sec-independent protein translocase protein TatC